MKQLLEVLNKYPAGTTITETKKCYWQKILAFSGAFTIILFAVIIAIPTSNDTAQPHLLEIIGLAVVIISILGESQADRQLSHFKRDTGPDEVCERIDTDPVGALVKIEMFLRPWRLMALRKDSGRRLT